MNATHESHTRESIRKAAAAVFEAVPALLLAAALMMPAFAALA